MSLTPGATLQNRKYVIQKLLHLGDFGVTYQAQHAYLEQPVVLQTLSDSLCQRSNFVQLRQQFFNQVRSLAESKSKATRVLDCFEEGGMPFVVFELIPGQAPVQLTDWFPLSPYTTGSNAGSSSLNGSNSAALNSAMETLLPSASADGLVAQASPIDETLPAVLPTSTSLLTQPVPNASAKGGVASQARLTAMVHPAMLKAQPARSKAWMPVALVFISMMGGLLGVGYGLSMRLAPTAEAETGSVPSFSPRLFSREQSFPSDAEWPISETPQYTPDPTPIEEPVYRTTPTEDYYYTPPIQALPNETPAKDNLPDLPTVKSANPDKVNLPPEILPSPAPATLSDSPVNAPPETASTTQSAPSEPAPPPITPELPAALPDLPPIPEAAPVVPAVPAEPPVIKQ